MKNLNILLTLNLLLVTGYFVVNINRVLDENTLNLKTIEEMNQDIKGLKSDVLALKAANVKLSRLSNQQYLAKSAASASSMANAGAATDQGLEVTENESDHQAFNPIEMEKKQEEKQAKMLEKISNAFLAETSDQSWSPEASALIKSFFESDNGAKINVVDFECRKTLCKVELTKPQNSEVDDSIMMAFPMYISKALSQGSFFHEKNEDGSTNVTIYLVRNGFDMPT